MSARDYCYGADICYEDVNEPNRPTLIDHNVPGEEVEETVRQITAAGFKVTGIVSLSVPTRLARMENSHEL